MKNVLIIGTGVPSVAAVMLIASSEWDLKKWSMPIRTETC